MSTTELAPNLEAIAAKLSNLKADALPDAELDETIRAETAGLAADEVLAVARRGMWLRMEQDSRIVKVLGWHAGTPRD